MPTRNAGLATILLSGTFLASLAGFTLLAPQLASAVCNPDPVNANNQIVECTDTGGVENTGVVDGGFNTTTVNIQDGAAISSGAASAVSLLSSSTVNMFGNGQAASSGNAVIFLNNGGGTVTMNDNSRILGQAAVTSGISMAALGNIVTLNDSASIRTIGHGIDINGASIVTISHDAIVASQNGHAVQFENGINVLSNAGTLFSPNGTAVLGGNNAGSTDRVTNAGTIIGFGGGNTAIDLQGGDDNLILTTGSSITGAMVGGLGQDTVTFNGSGSEDDLFVQFENAVMDGGDWSLLGDSTFSDSIVITQGRLGIDGNIIVSAGLTTVQANGILGGSGRLTSSVNNVGGRTAPGPSGGVGTLDVVGNFTQNGGAFDIDFDQNGIDLLDVQGGQLALNLNPSVNVNALKGGSVNGIFAHADNNIVGPIGAVNFQGNGGAIVIQELQDLRLIAIDGTQLVAGNAAGLQAGLDYLETVSGIQLSESRSVDRGGRRVWARGFGHFRNEEARDGNQAYDTRTAGTAFGGEFEIVDGLTLGGSLGYGNTRSEVAFDTADTQIDGEFAALYARYEIGQFFMSATASGGFQQFEISRDISTNLGRDTAEAETDGRVIGGNVQLGANFDFGQGWRITPSAGASYQRQSIDGYRESGANRGNVEIEDQESDVLRLNAQLNLGKTIDLNGFSLTPHVSAGVVRQINYGGTAKGTFSNGAEFEVALQDDDQVLGMAGAGVDVGIANGVGISLDYQGMYAGDTTDHAVIGGVSFKW